jgi:transposase-like protein
MKMRKVQFRQKKFAMVRDWMDSGLSQTAYARERKISFHQLNYWVRKYDNSKKQVEKPNGFIKLPETIKQNLRENIFSEVIFTNGNRLRFYNPVDISQLKSIAS